MSGDNLHGIQPIKFYSENMTLTKIILIEHYSNLVSNEKNTINLQDKHNRLKEFIAS